MLLPALPNLLPPIPGNRLQSNRFYTCWQKLTSHWDGQVPQLRLTLPMHHNTAKSVIDAKGTYGLDLWPNFCDGNRKGNEYGRETLMVIDHNADTKYGNTRLTQVPAVPRKTSQILFPTQLSHRHRKLSGSWRQSRVCIRDIANGRPFIRIRPNYTYTMLVAFPASGRATITDTTALSRPIGCRMFRVL
jgi:hypothetical protein